MSDLKKSFKNVNIMNTQVFRKIKYELKGHPKPYKKTLCQNHPSTFVYGPILIKICMNANIMKTHYFHKIIYDLKCHFYVIKKLCNLLTLRPFDLITIDLRSYGQLLSLF